VSGIDYRARIRQAVVASCDSPPPPTASSHLKKVCVDTRTEERIEIEESKEKAGQRVRRLSCLVAEVLVPAPPPKLCCDVAALPPRIPAVASVATARSYGDGTTGARGQQVSSCLPLVTLHHDNHTFLDCAAWSQSPGLRAMRAYYARANEVEGTSTDGTIVAYYCAASVLTCGSVQCCYLRSSREGAGTGRAYGFSKVVANMGALTPSEKQELMGYMDQLERVRTLSALSIGWRAACYALMPHA
jgi:hypothetical protein